MKKTCVLTVLALMFAAVAYAGPHTFGQQLAAAQCSPGPSSKLVLNIVFQVTGDADSGFAGYWAIDSYTKHVQVWDQGNGNYCAQVKYNGSFMTVAGPSPSGQSTVAAGVTGTMEGGYTATITGASFAPGTKRTKGSIGTKDYGCSISGGSAIGCSYYSWFADYFGGVGDLTQTFWGWSYNAGDNGTWINAAAGSSGDVSGS